MNQRDKVVVKKILNEIKEIEAFVSGLDEAAFLRQKLHQKAVVMSLINIGELTKALSPGYQERHDTIPWKSIVGLRNLAVHQYAKVTMENIWITVKKDIPTLKEAIGQEAHKAKDEINLDI